MIINFICILIGILIGMLYTICKQQQQIIEKLRQINENIESVVAVNPWGNRRYIRAGEK